MLKKTITFPDFNGNPVQDDFYFNFTRAEILALEAKYEGGLQGVIARISATQNANVAYNEFRNIVIAAYGVRTPDGGWIKNQEIRDKFEASEAFSELIFSFLENPDEASVFINQLVPRSVDPNAQPTNVPQTARERSEALMQGHLPKQPAPTPTQTPTAAQVGTPVAQPSEEELARFRQWQAQANEQTETGQNGFSPA